MLNDTGLVLEGGGMRGVYTAGVLEYLLEQDIVFPYVIGVSAGACNAASYLSKQKGRNKIVNIDYVTDHRYISWRNFFKTRQFFGMDFIFNEIPHVLVPYHYEEFFQSSSEFVIGTTDCHTGEPVYFGREEYGQDMLTVLKASSSLPFIAPEIEFNGRTLLDGGISDPVPIRQAQDAGYKRNVVVLTRNQGYMKKPARLSFLLKRKYPHYTGLQKALLNRYETYNQTTAYLEEEEQRGNVILIRPEQPLEVGRMERNPIKLEKLYIQGYKDAERMKSQIIG
ncbi:patatin family protein [Cytobacillus spongiae]|uniref:patatin-like phospholipase family protein n=1 Tax=Cytobacillus spongiae TaxID=2901381 RepID=UPI001F3AC6CD|nr:patatin family protein [Cytobacillus spongiae]UII54433.1 patatin family protein [Cytobacillus spongiae]